MRNRWSTQNRWDKRDGLHITFRDAEQQACLRALPNNMLPASCSARGDGHESWCMMEEQSKVRNHAFAEGR